LRESLLGVEQYRWGIARSGQKAHSEWRVVRGAERVSGGQKRTPGSLAL
jgi:hypothetical protein